MLYNKLRTLISVGLVAFVAVGCGVNGEESADHAAGMKEKVEYAALGEFVKAEDLLPRIRYFDGGLESANDRCPVRKVKLNPQMTPAYVNGRPIGFC